MFSLSDDVRALATRSMADMLGVAFECYERAAQSEEGVEEAWLQQYMLGKISEKRRDSPRVYLEHYKQVVRQIVKSWAAQFIYVHIVQLLFLQAAQCLFEERAKYPKKISYILSPPFLAAEAVEVSALSELERRFVFPCVVMSSFRCSTASTSQRSNTC